MGLYDYDRTSGKRELDAAADPRIGNFGEDGDQDDTDKMNYRVLKSRKFSSDEDADMPENRGRGACLGQSLNQNRDDTRRNYSGSSKRSSDDDDHKIMQKRDLCRENISDRGRECETPWYGHDRVGNEWPQSRYGCRKEARTEALKTSSNYGISNENYDVIEVQTMPLEYGKAPVDAKMIPNEEHAQNDCWKEDDMNFHSQKATVQNDIMHVHALPVAGPFGLPGASPVPLNPAPPPISANASLPPFSPHVAWQGSNSINTNILSGPRDPRYSHALCSSSSSATYFNQPFGRGIPSALSGPIPNGTGWIHPRGSIPPGKAPSRGEQNDYSQNFVDTGVRPQNFIRKLELTSVVEDYPRLRELIQKKDEIVTASVTPPMYYKCDLREHVLSSEFFGTKFDVILVDPPWEEYVHRAPGAGDHWTFEEILDLKIEAIADTPSFIFLWVGDGIGLEQGRQCLKKWGFRRCEDICWVKTNKANASPGLRHDSHTLFQHSKEHCLMGIKGTVRRSTDGHIIHANIDTDVIVAEEPPYGSTDKPEDMYRIIEHFSLGRRRLELFGEDHNIRAGWLTLGKNLSSSNFDVEAYVKNFADDDGKVWQGGGGRNPPPEAPHLVLTTPEIESLRPKSPLKNQYQIQQEHSLCIPVTANTCINLDREDASNSNPSTCAVSFDTFTGREGSVFRSPDEMVFDVYHPANSLSFDLPNNGSVVGGYDLPPGTMNVFPDMPL